MEYQTSVSPTGFSGELGGGGRLSRKHVYDGVFSGGGARKSGPRVEDYGEIFGGSAASSIPLLDVPELNERNVSGATAARSSRVDYSKIFGGFGEAEFAVPYEELFAKPKKPKSFSSKDAGAPAEARLRVPRTDHSNFPEEKQVPVPEASFQTFDGAKQFNVLYHKVNPRNENGTNGTTHIAHLHAIPGYSCLVDDNRPSQITDNGKPARSVLNDAQMNVEVSKEIKKNKPVRKVVSGPQPSVASEMTSSSPAEYLKKSGRNRSISNDMPFVAFEFGLGSHPSRVQPTSSSPPPGGNKKGVFGASMNLNGGASRSDVSEGAAGGYSPPFFEEIDANSAAAASAAAVRKAIEEAQVKIKIAKELMERKKGGFQKSVKLSFNNGLKSQKWEVQNAGRAQRSNDKLAKKMREKEDTPGETFTGHVATKGSEVTVKLRDEIKSAFAKNVARETPCNEAKLASADVSLEEAEDWQETVVGGTTPPHIEPNSTEVDNRLEEAEDWHETVVGETPTPCSESRSTEGVNRLEEEEDYWQETVVGETPISLGQSKSVEADNCMEEVEDWEETEEFFETSSAGENGETSLQFTEEEDAKNWLPSGYETERQDNMLAGDKVMNPEDYGMKLEVFQEAPNQDKVGRVSLSMEGDVYTFKTKSVLELRHEEVDEEKLELTHRHNETNQTPTASYEQEVCESGPRKHQKQEGNTELHIQEMKEDKVMKELKAQNWVQIEKKQWEALNQNEMENKQLKIPSREENESRLAEVHQQKENGKVQEEAWDRVKCEQLEEEDWEQEENKKRPDVHRWEETKENSDEVDKEERKQATCGDLAVKEEFEKRLVEDGETDGKEELEEAKENNMMLEGEYPIDETENRQEETCEWVETERAEDERNPAASLEALKNQENNLELADEIENRDGTDDMCGQEEFESVEVNAEVLVVLDNARTTGLTELPFVPEEIGNQSNAHEEDKVVEEEDNYENAGLAQDFVKTDGIEKQTEDKAEALLMGDSGASLGETNLKMKNERYECGGAENESLCDQERLTEKVGFGLGETDEEVDEFDVVSIHETNENTFASSQEEGQLDNEMESLFDSDKHVEEVSFEQEQKDHECKESEVAVNHEKDETSVEFSDAEKRGYDGIEQTTEISEADKTSQSMDKKVENHHETLKMGRETENTLQKKIEVEKNQSKTNEEAKERETEKEKERLVVERAIREARERAFAEARERAEKAAVERAASEAHQRLKAEARERSEKASSEANDKLTAEKASREAKLRAERAAVERATAEARERALEKAMSDKAAIKARHQADKFPGDKFSGAWKDDRRNSSDQQYKDLGPSSSSRYPSSSNHAVPHSVERSSGANGESAQRCKAKMERHQRTAERAEKALAEKNMRDLLAQKEQTERNRLAQTLDADVKRWSSGKERNLRALLSTLQYILGPDSGWQPIPLTDLISTAAVKKAYRKATLSVHPDKLQQRGASIQHKYICEKVFDLLKEAWNKFSAEEK